VIFGSGSRRETWIGLPTSHKPWIDHVRIAENQSPSVTIRAHVAGSPKRAPAVRIDYSVGNPSHYGAIEATVVPMEGNVYEARWTPRNVPPGTEIYYRFTVADQNFSSTQEIPDGVVYDSWLHRNSDILSWISTVPVVILLYVIVCFAFLRFKPIVFLRFEARYPKLMAPAGVSDPVKFALTVCAAVLGIESLVRHERVAAAWLRLFRDDVRELTLLSDSTRAILLARADVRAEWIEHYRAGRTRIADLPATVQAEFLADTALLDGWVERYAETALAAFRRARFVQQRGRFISLPLSITDGEEQVDLPLPDAAQLKPYLDRQRAVIEIVGDGGTGKSTLAIYLAEALNSGLLTHRVVPLFLQDEFKGDLLQQLRGALFEATNDDELDMPMVESLLKSKRIALIFDALSERNAETRQNVASIYEETAANLILITTRRPIELGSAITFIEPQRLGVDRIVFFVVEYLKKMKRTQLFPRLALVPLAGQVIRLIEGRRGDQPEPVTPLFVTLFVDRACALQKNGVSLDTLPASIPEVILDNLRQTDPLGEESHADLVVAARHLSTLSLGLNYVPADFFVDDVGSGDRPFLQRLVDNGIVVRRERAGVGIYRFSNDPVAEYLAAIDLALTNKESEMKWTTWLGKFAPDADAARGFIAALKNVVTAYEEEFKIPAFVFQRLAHFKPAPDQLEQVG
jgi:hypothetical protein